MDVLDFRIPRVRQFPELLRSPHADADDDFPVVEDALLDVPEPLRFPREIVTELCDSRRKRWKYTYRYRLTSRNGSRANRSGRRALFPSIGSIG